MKNIAIIGNSAVTLVGFRLDLIKQLVQQGYSVYAFSPMYTDSLREKIRQAGAIPVHFEISRSGINPISELGVVKSLSKLLRLYSIDTTLTYFIKPVIYGTIAAKFAGVNNVNGMIAGLGYAFTNDMIGSMEPKRLIIKKTIERLFKFTLRWNRKVFFQNPDDLNEFVQKKLLPQGRAIQVNGSGINLSEYTFAPIPNENGITFLAMGRLLIEKGFLDYLQAANLIRYKYQNTRFILLGGYDENPSSIPKATIDNVRSRKIVEWYDHVEDVRSWLRKSSVFVLPSYREGTPRSTLEALATGRGVITTDVPGCRETVIEGVNGFFVPPRDPEKLAEAMERFILNPELIRLMGAESRKLAEEKFDVRKVNKKMMEEMGLLGDESMVSA